MDWIKKDRKRFLTSERIKLNVMDMGMDQVYVSENPMPYRPNNIIWQHQEPHQSRTSNSDHPTPYRPHIAIWSNQEPTVPNNSESSRTPYRQKSAICHCYQLLYSPKTRGLPIHLSLILWYGRSGTLEGLICKDKVPVKGSGGSHPNL